MVYNEPLFRLVHRPVVHRFVKLIFFKKVPHALASVCAIRTDDAVFI